VTVSPTDTWRLTATYSLLRAQIQEPPLANPATSAKNWPRHQATLRSAYDFTKRLSLDGQLRYVDAIASVPSYLTADFRLSYRPTDYLVLSLVGENLLDRQHPEQADQPFTTTAEVPRGFHARILWRF
jgi:iron complex outermembrane recepter protein